MGVRCDATMICGAEGERLFWRGQEDQTDSAVVIMGLGSWALRLVI